MAGIFHNTFMFAKSKVIMHTILSHCTPPTGHRRDKEQTAGIISLPIALTDEEQTL